LGRPDGGKTKGVTTNKKPRQPGAGIGEAKKNNLLEYGGWLPSAHEDVRGNGTAKSSEGPPPPGYTTGRLKKFAPRQGRDPGGGEDGGNELRTTACTSPENETFWRRMTAAQTNS